MVERPHPQSRNERQYGLQSFIVASPQAGSRSYIVPPPYPYMPKAYNKFRECCPPSLSSSAEVLHRSVCLVQSGCVVRTDWKIQRLSSHHSGSRSWHRKLNKEDATSLKTLPIEESVAMALPCEKNWLTRFPNIKTMSVQHFHSAHFSIVRIGSEKRRARQIEMRKQELVLQTIRRGLRSSEYACFEQGIEHFLLIIQCMLFTHANAPPNAAEPFKKAGTISPVC